MPCTNCGNDNQPIKVLGVDITSNCPDPCPDCSDGSLKDSNCILYTGPALSCLQINPNTSVQDIITSIDSKVCGILGDYSTYNTFCLGPISSQQQFVEGISNFVCNTDSNLNNFLNVTFPQYQILLDARFVVLENPKISCTSAGVLITDSIQTVLNKYCSKFSQIDGLLDTSSVNWNNCYTVSPLPTTIAQGFNVLISEICTIKSNGGNAILPVFNNISSCLPTPTSTDSLTDTIIKIRNRVCSSPTFDINALTWNCITKPSIITTDLQSAFQAVLSKTDSISGSLITQVSPDFSLVPIDPLKPCLGNKLSLTTSPNLDRYVAASVTDTSPGTLFDKLISGSNITLDFNTTPGKCIVSSIGGGVSNYKVKASFADASPDYMDAKIEGDPGTVGIGITTGYNIPDDKVQVKAIVDLSTLAQNMMNVIAATPSLLAQLCTLIANCPSPCAPPTNVIVTYSNPATSTTSTTTTTTTTI